MSVETACRSTGYRLFHFHHVLHSWKPRQHPFFNDAQESTELDCLQHDTAFLEVSGHAFQVWSLSFGFLGEVEICARNSRVDNLSRLQGWDVTAEGL